MFVAHQFVSIEWVCFFLFFVWIVVCLNDEIFRFGMVICEFLGEKENENQKNGNQKNENEWKESI